MERKTKLLRFTLERRTNDGKVIHRLKTSPAFGQEPELAGVITEVNPSLWAVGGAEFKFYIPALTFVIKRFLPHAKIGRVGIDGQGVVTASVEIDK